MQYAALRENIRHAALKLLQAVHISQHTRHDSGLACDCCALMQFTWTSLLTFDGMLASESSAAKAKSARSSPVTCQLSSVGEDHVPDRRPTHSQSFSHLQARKHSLYTSREPVMSSEQHHHAKQSSSEVDDYSKVL